MTYYVILDKEQNLSIDKKKRSVVLYSGGIASCTAFKDAYEYSYPTKNDIDNVCTYDIIRTNNDFYKRAWKFMGNKEQWVEVNPVTTEPIVKKEEKFTLSHLCDLLQYYAHEGHAMDEVEIFDDKGNLLSIPEKVELKYDHKKEVIAIILKHKE